MATGSRHIGSYELLDSLGRGGMGEVYRARDTRLKRDVALKVLPPSVANDPERLSRFQREAEVLASLNHPHIAAIYGLEEGDGIKALVLELIEGDTLADRIARGPIPIDEAMEMAHQIAQALEAAHDKGVIHRDLKPSNIALTRDGQLKVLDFGLAKAIEPVGIGQVGGSAAQSLSPTLTSPAMTQAGMILGTAAYMSPEQARGRLVDRRADIWAFGCVLYEMLTGRRSFAGDDITDTLAAVVRGEPDWSVLPADTPPAVRRLLRRCLAKDLRARLRDAGDALLELTAAQNDEAGTTTRVTERGKWPLAIASIATVVALVLMPGAFSHWREGERPRLPAARFNVARPPEVRTAYRPVVSRDGRYLAFVGNSAEGTGVFVRSMDSGGTRRIPNTIGATTSFAPIWSPDSKEIAFVADQKLWRVQLEDGRRLPICDIPAGGFLRAGDWGEDGSLIFAALGRLWRVAPGDAAARELLKPDPGILLLDPMFLPGGRQFLFTARGAPLNSRTSMGRRGAYVGSLDGTEPKLVAPDAASATFADDYLLYVRSARGGMVPVAQAFDSATLSPVGEPIALDESGGLISATSGRLAYLRGDVTKVQLTWFSRTGERLGTVGQPDAYPTFELDRDGRRVVVSRGELAAGAAQNIWLLDVRSGAMTPLTTGDFGDVDPRWSPDQLEIVFGSTRAPGRAPHRVSLAGGKPQLVMPWDKDQFALDDWSSTGVLLFHPTSNPVLFARKPDGETVEAARALTGFIDQGRFSPDGRFVAFNSNDSGLFNVSVVPFPPSGERWNITTSGGVQPTWSADGRELFYLTPDGTLMSVKVNTARGFQPDPAVQLFQTDLTGKVDTEEYAVHPDGRFLMSVPAGDTTVPFTVITDWRSLLPK